MNFLINVIKGMMIGIANVIPGVSGGTMAVSLGIYDKMIDSISGILKHLRDSIAFLFPLVIGMGIGIVGFTYMIEYLLSKHTFITCMTFVGLILGGIPIIVKGLKNKMHISGGNIGIAGILAFVIAFASPAVIARASLSVGS